MRVPERRPAVLLLLALLGLGAPAARAAEPGAVIAVLSSEAGPYREALAGFTEGFGAPVRTFILPGEQPSLSRETKVVVVFGTKAALRRYPDRATLVYTMAPGAESVDPTTIAVQMELGAAGLLSNLKRIQPGLRRLGVLWRSPQLTDYAGELRGAAAASGLTVTRVLLEDGSDLPDRLRRLYGKVDALWLPPDPLLLNADSLSVFVGFSRANRVPLYVPTSGLAGQGAVASVGPNAREMGRLAGIAAAKAAAGAAQGSRIFPCRAEVVINKSAAAEIGLKIPEDALRGADRVLP